MEIIDGEIYFLLIFPSHAKHTYSPSHIDKTTDFLDLLREYCEEKSETFTEF